MVKGGKEWMDGKFERRELLDCFVEFISLLCLTEGRVQSAPRELSWPRAMYIRITGSGARSMARLIQ